MCAQRCKPEKSLNDPGKGPSELVAYYVLIQEIQTIFTILPSPES